jgi:hypothetical protein
MRGACLGLMLLAVSAASGSAEAAGFEPSVRLHDGRLYGSSKGTHTALRFQARNRIWQQIVVGGQADVPIGPLTALELLGETTAGVVILSARYASREGFPSKQCGAGSEIVVRVLQLRPKLRLMFSQLVDSCWESIEGGERRWQADDHTLHLETTRSIADKTMHQEVTYRVAIDGTTSLLTMQQLE